MRKGDRHMLNTVAKIKPIKVFTSCSPKMFSSNSLLCFLLRWSSGQKMPHTILNQEWFSVTMLSVNPLGRCWPQDPSREGCWRRRKWETGARPKFRTQNRGGRPRRAFPQVHTPPSSSRKQVCGTGRDVWKGHLNAKTSCSLRRVLPAG